MDYPIKQFQWEKDSCGSRMITAVPIINIKENLAAAKNEIKKNIEKFGTINYVYAIDDEGKLEGVFSLKEIFRSLPTTPVMNICRKSLIFTHPEIHQEKAAYLALKNNIKAIPVVDKNHILLGAIPNDTILSILYKETHEDILHFAGVHSDQIVYDNILNMPIFQALYHRIPWLFLGLCGGLLGAGIINLFESTLQRNIILAAYIPLIVYIAGAVSAQMSVFLIRDFAIMPEFNYKKYFLKQTIISLIIAFLFGIFVFGASYIFYHKYRISFVLGVSLLAAISSATITGLAVPYIFVRLKQDPANASGPLGTIIQDLLSILLYFAIASFFI